MREPEVGFALLGQFVIISPFWIFWLDIDMGACSPSFADMFENIYVMNGNLYLSDFGGYL